MGCGQSKPATAPAKSTANPVHPVHQPSLNAGELVTAAALKAKRRANVMAETQEVSEPYVPKNIPKDDRIRALLGAALRENVLFASLGSQEVQEMIAAMAPVEFPATAEVIKQGAIGDNFYVIESGSFDILVNGKKVADFGDGTPNMSFGELALLYNSPRAATVVSRTASKLWAIDRRTFRGVVAKASHAQHSRLKTTLRRGILEDLTDDQINKVAAAATVVHYHTNDQIIRKGEQGEVFYIIEKGSVICKNLPGGQSNNILHAGDYFGERALLLREPRAADVFADSDVTLVAIDREDFENLLGHLRDLLEHNLGMRLLLCVPLLAHLSNEERARLLEKLNLVSFDPRTAIIKQGTPVTSFYIIKEGSVEVVEGDKVTATLIAGQWFGDGELRSGALATNNIIAKTSVQLFALDKASYQSILGNLSPSGRSAPAAAAAASGGAGGDTGGEAAVGILARQPVRTERPRLGLPFSALQQRATLGTGTFGRVKLVYHPPTKKAYALKILQKVQIVQLRQQGNIMNEKRLLMSLDHPFILKLYDTYKDKDRLYMLLELVQGGELFSRLQNSATPGRVSTNDAKFYGACVLDAFEHLHSKSIAYRDLKPENLLIDSDGYLKVVDFGFAKVVEDRTYTLCGTPEYLAPELVLGKGHGVGVDYWALGVLLYEMVCGYSPFADMATNDQMKICKNILRGTVTYPTMCTGSLRELVGFLLEKDIKKRFGCLKGGAGDIKRHKFFKPGMDFEQLVQRKVAAPWKPPIRDQCDTSNFDPYDEDDYCPPYRDDGSAWDADF